MMLEVPVETDRERHVADRRSVSFLEVALKVWMQRTRHE
jgi:hypothetical protein